MLEDENGSLTVRYPEDWFAEIDETTSSIGFANSEVILEQVNDPDYMPLSGQFFGLATSFVGLSDNLEPLDALTSLIDNLNVDDDVSVSLIGEVEDLTINDRNAASIIMRSTQGDAVADVLLMLIVEGDSLILLAFGTIEGETDQFTEEMRAIAGSVEFEPASSDEDE